MSSDFSIRRLGDEHREAVKAHFFSLTGTDRYSRFMYGMGDKSLEEFVAKMDFASSTVFGAFRKSASEDSLVGIAQLDCDADTKIAEVAVSVNSLFRRSGYGSALMKAAISSAAERACHKLSLSCLSSNVAMSHLARRFGFTLAEATYDTYERCLDTLTACA